MILECTIRVEGTDGNFIWGKEYGGIHIYKGKDYSDELTVGNLFFQSTGFPDVYAAENNNLNIAPDTSGKAHYSDLYFEMLAKIIEQLEASSLNNAFKKYDKALRLPNLIYGAASPEAVDT